MPKTRTRGWEQWLPKLAEAGLSGDHQRLEQLLITMVRRVRGESPELSQELGALLAQYSTNHGGLRWANVGPPPSDRDEGFALVRDETPFGALAPVLPPEVFETIDQFVRERQKSQQLFSEGFLPPSSLLLTGSPGTGKTMLARWLAATLGLPLLVQDLAVSISSFLGKTGFNLRRTLDYARGRPCVLLLDEFDAIAKRRNDDSELGELKRIVNVLLKELEDWPTSSVLVAATNHPDLLDTAIGRRFHVVLDLPLPGWSERSKILERAAGRFSEQIPAEFLDACATIVEGRTGADIDALMQAAVRRHIITETSMIQGILIELRKRSGQRFDGKTVGFFVRALNEASQNKFTVRELASFFGKSASTIQHHLKKEAKVG